MHQAISISPSKPIAPGKNSNACDSICGAMPQLQSTAHGRDRYAAGVNAKLMPVGTCTQLRTLITKYVAAESYGNAAAQR